MKVSFKIIALVCILPIINNCKKSNSNSQPGCLPANISDSLVAFYSFGSGSINDVSGNNYNLINITSATSGPDRAGNANCAFMFTQANGDYLKYSNPAFINNFQSTPFSISLWYKPLGIQTQTGYELLIGRDTSFHCPDTYGQWSVGLYDLRKAVFGINEYSLWQDSIGLNIWKHLVVTCNGTDLKLYINGIVTPNTAETGCGIPVPTLNIGDLLIGKGYNGLLDDIIIYKKVLTTSEITQLSNLQACCQ